MRLRLINDTDEYHPIHLHGHVMSAISRNGPPDHRESGAPGLDPCQPHETWEVGFVADSPGLWMVHCHVVVHAACGLRTVVSYQGIRTPYTVGPQSGNFPE